MNKLKIHPDHPLKDIIEELEEKTFFFRNLNSPKKRPSGWSELVDAVYLIAINDDTRYKFSKEAERQGFEDLLIYCNAYPGAKIIASEDLTEEQKQFIFNPERGGGGVGLRTSYNLVINHAHYNGYRRILVCEEDCVFKTRIDSNSLRLVSQAVKEYDINCLNLGTQTVFGYPYDQPATAEILKLEKNLAIAPYPSTLSQSMVLSSHCFDTFLESLKNPFQIDAPPPEFTWIDCMDDTGFPAPADCCNPRERDFIKIWSTVVDDFCSLFLNQWSLLPAWTFQEGLEYARYTVDHIDTESELGPQNKLYNYN